MKKKIIEGDTCIFDPYNELHQKVGYNDITCVRILDVKKRLFKTVVDFFDLNSGKLFENIPIKYMYKINSIVDPVTVVRFGPDTPIITDLDIDFLQYCYMKLEDKDAKEYARIFRKKLKLYKLNSIFTEGE